MQEINKDALLGVTVSHLPPTSKTLLPDPSGCFLSTVQHRAICDRYLKSTWTRLDLILFP